MVFTDTKPRFLPDHVTVKAGTVVFFLENVPGDSGPYFNPTHNLQVGPALDEVLAGTPDVKVGEKVTFTVEDLTPGTYVYWCSVPTLDQKDHARYGMVGMLTVTP